jgi:hypothetical protein
MEHRIMKHILLGMMPLLLFCACYASNKDKQEKVMFSSIDQNEVYYVQRGNIEPHKCFILKKQDNGNVDIAITFMSDVIQMEKKSKDTSAVSVSCKMKSRSRYPNSTEMLREFDLCLRKISDRHIMDSLRYIYCSTMDFSEIAVIVSHDLLSKRKDTSRLVFETEVDKAIYASPLRQRLNSVLRKYNVEVDSICALSEFHERTFLCVPKKSFLKLYDVDSKLSIPDNVLLSPITIKIRKIEKSRY